MALQGELQDTRHFINNIRFKYFIPMLLLLATFIPFIFLGALFNFLLLFLIVCIVFRFAPTRRTAKIISHILVVIECIIIFRIAFEVCDNLWQIILGLLISYILLYLTAYFSMKMDADVCPNCGEWNRIELVKRLGRDDYKQRVVVERDIHNKEGEKIGSYDASEVRDFTTYTNRYRCKACGKSYIGKRTMQW